MNQKISSYKDLIVWQKSVELSVLVYELLKTFPKEEQFGLSIQMKRAVVSIASNIAEGNGRRKTSKEYVQFLRISLGSSQELETQLIIAKKLGFLKENQEKLVSIEGLLEEVQKMLNSIINRL